MLTGWKKQGELEFLNELSSVPLQQCLRHLQTAFSNFCSKRAKYPNFKKKRNGGSAEFSSSGFRWRDGQLFLDKGLEPLPIRWSRQVPEGCIPSSVTVSLSPAGHWHLSLLVDGSHHPAASACRKLRWRGPGAQGVHLTLEISAFTQRGQAASFPLRYAQRWFKILGILLADHCAPFNLSLDAICFTRDSACPEPMDRPSSCQAL